MYFVCTLNSIFMEYNIKFCNTKYHVYIYSINHIFIKMYWLIDIIKILKTNLNVSYKLLKINNFNLSFIFNFIHKY